MAGAFIEELARGLVRAGDRVTVLAPHARGLPGTWESGGVEVITFRYAPVAGEIVGYGRSLQADERLRAGAALATPLYLAAARRAVLRQLGRRRFDLVHAHWIVPNGVASAPAGTAVPLAIGLHGSDVFLAEKPLARRVARHALRRCRLLTGCSSELVRRICALGFPEERARVIPYGVDTRLFSPRERSNPEEPAQAPATGGRWRERLGIPAAAPLLLGVGRMATKKGFHVLAAVLPRLFAAVPDLHVVLAGGGDRLAELAAAARTEPRLHLPGPVLRDALPDLYRAADLFVMPAVHDAKSNVDGLPNVILEAMASGLPVVASAISGIPLAVADGATGLLVPEGDRGALAEALLLLLGDPALARRMGEEGRRKAEEELTWDAVTARYRQAYEGALDMSSGSGNSPGAGSS